MSRSKEACAKPLGGEGVWSWILAVGSWHPHSTIAASKLSPPSQAC